MPSLVERDCRPELMDDPALDRAEHQKALEGLRRVNRWSRSAGILWPALRDLAPAGTSANPLRVLDIACGGGDVTCELARRCRRFRLPVQIDGCDVSPFAVEYSRNGQTARDAAAVRFFQLDVFEQDLPGDYDVLMCSLFLHHLSRDQASQLMTGMAMAAKRSVLINDLRRTRLGYSLAWAGCRLLTRSPIVHHDGPLSVRAAFTTEEIRELALETGLAGARISHHWPQRFLLSWRKPA